MYFTKKTCAQSQNKARGSKIIDVESCKVLKKLFLGQIKVKNLIISKNQNSVICLSIGGGQQCLAGGLDIVRPLDLIC